MAFRNPVRRITLPDGAHSGQHRFVIGADTPNELQLYGINEALLAYVTDILYTKDPFNRTVSNGWGTEPYTGRVYTASGGSASDYSVGSGVGKINSTTVGVNRAEILDVGQSDVDYSVTLSLPITNATGQFISQWVVGRFRDLNNFYVARLDLDTGGGVNFSLQKNVAGSLTVLAGGVSVGTGHAANEQWRVRFQVSGTVVRGKAWKPAVTSEPSAWTLSTTDSALTNGTNIGVMVRLETGNTNAPCILSVDDLEMRSNPPVTNGPEVGYFWIGSSNRFDGPGDGRVLAYGNVTYPTPGDPTSPGMSDVFTNFQQNMHAQYPQTIFKDHALTVWNQVRFETDNGFTDFEIDGHVMDHGFVDDASDASSTAAIGAETTIFTIPSNRYRNGRAFRLVLSGHFNFSAANGLARVKFYRNSTAGTLLTTFFFGTTAGAAGGAPGQYFHGEAIFKNNSGADITDTIVVTLTCFTAGTCQMFSGADTIRRVEVFDHGSAADHALVQQM